MSSLSYLKFIWSGILIKIALLFLCFGVAHAHNLPSGMGTINANKDKAFVVLSLPVSLFAGVDDDDDGKLSQTELQRHQIAIRDTIQQGFSFYNISAKNQKATNTSQPQQMKTVTVSLIDDSPNHSHSHNNHHSNSHQGHNHGEHEHANGVDASATINYLGVVSFATPINKLRVTSDLFSKAPANYEFELYAKRSNQPNDTSSKPKREKMLLSATQTEARFFANKAVAANKLALDTSNQLQDEQKSTENQYIRLILWVLLGLAIIVTAFILKIRKPHKLRQP